MFGATESNSFGTEAAGDIRICCGIGICPHRKAAPTIRMSE
jgi:hypothetical protein